MSKPIDKWVKFVWPAEEVWRAVPGYDGYEVSDAGRIRSLRRGNTRLLACSIDEDGYARAGLYRNGQRSFSHLHRLVALVFIGPAPVDRPICCHNDNDKRNNRPSNLRWDTQAGNMADKVAHGTHQIGGKCPTAVITEEKAREIKALLASTPRYKGKLTDIAKRVGCTHGIVCKISEGKSWQHA